MESSSPRDGTSIIAHALEQSLKMSQPHLDLEALKRQKYFPERRRAIRLKRWAIFDPDKIQRVSVKYAESQEELAAAFRIVHDAYVEAGYIAPHPSGMRLRIFEALPHNITFLGNVDDQPVATASLVLDSPLGLPMEESYPDEINALRRAGRKLAEVSGLATVRELRHKSMFLYVCKVLLAYAMYIGVDEMCIMISPEHEDFFREVLLFESLAGKRVINEETHDTVVACRLNLDPESFHDRWYEAYNMAEYDTNLYVFFFTWEHDVFRQRGYPGSRVIMTPQMLHYFFVEQSDVFRNATPEQMRFVQACYPFYNFRKIMAGDFSIPKALRTLVSPVVPDALLAR